MKKILTVAVSGMTSGLLVGIGATAYLSCEQKAVGAMLFAIALFTICTFSLYLFTGRVGYLVTDCHLATVRDLCVGFAGNVLGTWLTALIIKIVRPGIIEKARELCQTKLTQDFYETLILAAFCGMLMYIATEIYKTKNSIAGVLFCVPVYIFSGFEHSIADVLYFTASGFEPVKWLMFILFAAIVNTAGAMLLRGMHLISGSQKI